MESEIRASAPASRDSFWRRRITEPLKQQIRQGATAEKLAQSVAWGALLGIFPILGTTTTLCAIFGVALRLNHIAVQAVNWLVYPLQLVMIIPFLQLGNYIFGLGQFPLSLSEITAQFEADFWGSMGDMGWLALRGIVAWVLIAAPLILLIRIMLTPVFRRMTRVLKANGNFT